MPVLDRGIRKVLVPLDFSESAGSLLDVAMELVRARGAVVRLLHVVELPLGPAAGLDLVASPTPGPGVLLDIQEAADRRLRAIAAERPGLSVETRVVVGTAVREIVREARDWGADVIVVGTHGRTGLSHVFLGSVAENVVRLAPCPVLTVKRPGFTLQPL